MLSRTAVRAYSSVPNGIKISTKESVNGLTKLHVVVTNAGAKDGKFGTSHLLSKFAFLNNGAKSALRFTRESELLGGHFKGHVKRDALVLKTKFLKQDLPYYVEALGNVLSNTQFTPHEFEEVVLPSALAEARAAHSNSHFTGLEKLHEITFRRGLGAPLYYHESTPIQVEELAQYAQDNFTGENIQIVAQGADEADLTKFVEESAFCYLPKGSKAQAAPTEFHKNAEARIPATGKSTALIGFPIKPADFGKYEVLSAAIGTSTLPTSVAPLFKIPGATSHLYKYNDAGLFVISVSGKASDVAQGIRQAKKVAESVTSSDLNKAVKSAELSIALQSKVAHPLEFKPTAADAPVKDFNYVAVGDLDVLPFASEL
ncbi:Qcr2 ubiquinol-cytochrome-c reductase [Candida orthopsilosis Co 90-125]|uniref:Cytochrome b-c1 complex subunit 2, mitochondrial n=1 Tax=Candida orthopsilosis (strain 90-125) TaxID=1136231 RepID=H8X0P5_CANO9|nr:Qcr2 ubiquinol-cytochrome-c reductase [Candida orthopsilosis Co 90-125]CCG21934.1 Qcr2 ubiquinol-cytochrome-c reductase [Candida orthopsilosis Co 90-125]